MASTHSLSSIDRNFYLTESELKQDPEELFTVMDKLGEGSYGAVFKAMHRKSSTIVALKIVPADEDLDEIIKEINIMMDCDSPSIIRLFGHFFKADHLWMFIEFCPAGSVADIMRLTGEYMAEGEIAVICRNVLQGMKYLHERRKIHRDIKAGNILLNLKGEAKLADFGVAGQLSDTVAKRNTVIGTPFWMAPEIIQEVGYGVEADVWSLGITCIEMAEGKPPYYNVHPMRAIFIIPTKPPATLDNPNMFTAEFNRFIAKCLTKNPTQRPSAVELLKEPFVVNAPHMSILHDKVARVAEAIAQGALNGSADDVVVDAEDDSQDSALPRAKHEPSSARDESTLRHAGTTSTIRPSAVTKSQDLALPLEEFSTMVVNDTMQSVIVRPDEATATISFAKMVKQQAQQSGLKADSTMKPQSDSTLKPRTDKQQEPPPMPQMDSGTELNELLRALEENMEKEIKQIRRKYEEKRQPILEAIASKKGSGGL